MPKKSQRKDRNKGGQQRPPKERSLAEGASKAATDNPVEEVPTEVTEAQPTSVNKPVSDSLPVQFAENGDIQLVSENHTLKERIEELESEKVSLLEQQTAICAQLEDQQSAISTLRDQLASAESQMVHNETEWSAYRKSAEQEVTSLMEKVTEVTGKCEKLEEEKSVEKELHRKEYQQLISETGRQLKETAKLYEDEIDHLTKQLDSVEKELQKSAEDSSKALDAVEAKAKTISEELEKNRKDFEEREQTVRQKLEIEIKRGKRLEEEKVLLEEQYKQYQTEHEKVYLEACIQTEINSHDLDEETNQFVEKLEQSRQEILVLKEASESKENSLRQKLQAAVRKGKKIEEEKILLEEQYKQYQAEHEKVYLEACIQTETNGHDLDEEMSQLVEKLDESKQEVVLLKKDAENKENNLRQKLQAAIKKGKRIEEEKSKMEQQLVEIVTRTNLLAQKLPEFTELQQMLNLTSEHLSHTERQMSEACKRLNTAEFSLQQLTQEKEKLLIKVKDLESRNEDLERNLESANSSNQQLKEQNINNGRKIEDLEKVITQNDNKLIRAREAIERLRKAKSDLIDTQSILEKDLEDVKEQKAALLTELEAMENVGQEHKELIEENKKTKELEENIQKLEKLYDTSEDEKVNLENQINTLKEENKTSLVNQEMVQSVFSAAAHMAQQLELPFMVNESTHQSQLHAVCLLLEGAQVGIQKNQEQVAYMSDLMTEVEASKLTIRQLEDDLVKLKEESSTPVATYSAIDMNNPGVGGGYSQTKRVKRRDPQDSNDNFIVDFNEAGIEEEQEQGTDDSKQIDYMPLISVQAFRSAPASVLHLMKNLDQQTQSFGKLMGHKPFLRIGTIIYSIFLHLILILWLFF